MAGGRRLKFSFVCLRVCFWREGVPREREQLKRDCRANCGSFGLECIDASVSGRTVYRVYKGDLYDSQNTSVLRDTRREKHRGSRYHRQDQMNRWIVAGKSLSRHLISGREPVQLGLPICTDRLKGRAVHENGALQLFYGSLSR
ncbi:hypothetical protein BD324DRAFT_505681 [Kockovaella imperatae]|uniref:Uncharacterized protein n=1 Tax=Kockovaella imperatae TaxID=4999 RepID=A0A1Y1UG89_9TREE|nr:hypothetical protein BD324DRAFT_505681 [Kockovaella imperatae]ORX36526.1 hypothetical protein BD324DRAFT_505681 [Kockovaella imperatae]